MTHDELRAAGADVDAAAHEKLSLLVELFRVENARVNLSAIREPADIWALHNCDSLALLPELDRARPANLLDFGTGGGFPGLPIAICRPQLQVTLLDATRKKVEAVQRMIDALDLHNAKAQWARGESLPANVRFDAITARAVADLRQLVAWCGPLLASGGCLWLYKSMAGAEREVGPARSAADRCGLTFTGIVEYRLPEPHGSRVLVRYEKQASR